MLPLRVGIVGIGFGRQVHVPAFSGIPGCRVVGIAASSPSRARAAGERLGLRAFPDWAALVGDAGVDAVSIAVPPRLQPEIALAALGAGKHVFCEKPLAASSRDARKLVSAAARAKKANMVDFEFPEIPAWRKGKELLARRVLGGLRHVHVTWHVETYAHRIGLDSWKTRDEDGGGMLNGFVSHCFHYLEWMFGPIAWVSAALSGPKRRCDALVRLALELASGVPVSLTASADAYRGCGHRIEVYGDRGSFVIENAGPDYVRGARIFLALRANGSLRRLRIAGLPGRGDGRVAAARRLAGRFVLWARTGRRAAPDLAEGLRVQKLLDAARASARDGSRFVEVSR